MSKDNSTRVGQYLVSKNGAKYLKFENAKNKDGSLKGEDVFPITINEGDIMFLNLMDDDFREKYNVPDFVRGTVSVPDLPQGAAPVTQVRVPNAKTIVDDVF